MVSQGLAAVTKAADKAASAFKARDTAICYAYVEGATIRAIAKAAGLSPARVHQIVRGETRSLS